METVKRLFISLIALLGCTAGAWAIEQDSDGNYLIGSVQDWEEFAELIKTTPTANARMTADVDLGSSQAMLGDSEHEDRPTYYYQGTFDGQGYKLTVHYTGTSQTAPFAMISKATIKNIHVDGTISNSSGSQPSVVARAVYGKSTLESIWSSLVITDTRTGWDETACLVGCVDGYKSGSVDILDCLFTGTINSSGSYNGCFVGYINSGGSATMTNCLSLGTFNYTGGSYDFRGTHTNCYVKQFPKTIPESMRVTDSQLADGTIATALGDGWAQDPLTHQPVPKIFTTVQDEDGYYLIGSVQDWKRFADIVNSGTNTAANAKMTADVDLGDDQTYISPDWHGEFSNLHYHGTFDGQGHTLTVHYNSDKYFHTPFSQTSGATIKNLHVAGTIKSTSSGPSHMSGLISNSAGNDVIQNVWVSADITGGSNSWIECGAFIGCNNCGNSTITDCLFTGSITTTGGNNGCFAGWVQSYNPSSITTTNCLSTGTFNIGSGSVSRGTLNNCYVKSYPYSIPSAMQVTDEQLANGTTAAALQAGRTDEIWVQDPVLGIPMLKIFANEETEQLSEALNGVFTINGSGEKVSFAKGNLQKIGSTYQFAEHQYDYFGTNQSDTHRDMFAFLDYNNPDNGESWSMLSRDEWKYLFATRTVTNTLSDGARYTMATIGDTYKGLIIFPDYYTHPEGTDFTLGVFNSNSNYTAQVSLEGWAMMEAAGCVFLPAAGYCSRGYTWTGVGEYVCYMSTTPSGMYYYDPYFRPDGVYLDETSDKQTWSSIRLVLRLQPLTYTVPASGVGTFSSDVNIHLPEGLNAHYCRTYYAERSAISVVNISSGVVPANTGVLLSGTPGETFNLYPTPETADDLEGNALVAVTKPVHISPTKGDYTNFMMKGGKFIKIADESYTVKMPANRAYLPLLTEAISGSNAKEIMLYWDDEEATGIESLTPGPSPKGEGSIYNLNGQKLSAPQKGINIINGRKVIVK